MQLRVAEPQDWAFVVQMARDACMLEQRPRPAADAPAVVAVLPGPQDVAVIAAGNDGRSLGAAWLHTHQPPLLSDAHGRALPELVMAVLEKERGKGIGAALVDALAAHAARDFSALTLNVHVRNPAVRLYTRSGFSVAGAGRGNLGVAMIRRLQQDGI